MPMPLLLDYLSAATNSIINTTTNISSIIITTDNITSGIISGNISGGGASSGCQVDGNFTPVFLPSIYGVSLILGVVGNAAGIFCFCRHMRPWSPLTVYMVNLAVSDLCYVLSLPFLIDYYVARTWRYAEWHCRAQRATFHANMYASILFLTVIAGHRYAGIVHPLRCRGAPIAVSRRASALVSAAVWAAVAGLVLPQVWFVRLGVAKAAEAAEAGGGVGGEVVKCYDTTTKDMLQEYLPYSFVLSVLGFFVPFCAMLFFYGSVVRALAGTSKGRGGGGRGGGGGGGTGEAMACAVTPADRRRTKRIVGVTLVLFAVCFLPYHVMRLWNLLVRLYPPEECSTSTNVYLTYQVTRGLASLNSCLDPVLYAFARGGVRSALRESLRSVSRSELSRLSLRHLDRISALGSAGAGGGGGGEAAATGEPDGGRGCAGDWEKLRGDGDGDLEEVFEEAGRTTSSTTTKHR
ncbi:P2Y purinoceptor 1-like [Petromyzon marinus]|uniref:P2Y purinoceptor 1-like n=1 Tax=Petromyzon marinus TaxID=7757 RepID=UPI003F6EECD3